MAEKSKAKQGERKGIDSNKIVESID